MKLKGSVKNKIFLAIWIFFFILFVALGFWQLQRYHWKKNLLAEYQARQSIILSADSLGKPPEELIYYNLQLTGRLAMDKSLYWQNRYEGETYGYHLLTPLWLEHQKAYVILDRGFVETPLNLQQLRALAEDQVQQRVVGLVYYPDRAGFMLGPDLSKDASGHQFTQGLDFKALSRLLQGKVYPFIVYLQSPADPGLKRFWQEACPKDSDTSVCTRQEQGLFANIMPASRHLGYAVQWFAMALTLAIAVLLSFLRRR